MTKYKWVVQHNFVFGLPQTDVPCGQSAVGRCFDFGVATLPPCVFCTQGAESQTPRPSQAEVDLVINTNSQNCRLFIFFMKFYFLYLVMVFKCIVCENL